MSVLTRYSLDMSNQATTPTQAHCENCGATDFYTDEGYTDCCNENVCSGHNAGYRFGTQEINQSACCWAVADIKFQNAGITVPENSSRI
jgi:uncharacterized protein CbrC (UPF0167 family)